MRLAEADAQELAELIQQHNSIADAHLARELQSIFYEAWTNDTQRVFGAAAALWELSSATNNAEIKAYAEWGAAISSLVKGELENCIDRLGKSEKLFIESNQTHTAATTRISKLYALALLGRYDEAIDCGLVARDEFLAHKDFLSAGKVEHNIGNIYARRDLHLESTPHFDSAHQYFSKVDDKKQLTMVENCLANAFAQLNNFREAERIYKQAIAHAESENMTVTQAEIEGNLGKHYLYQGRYDFALDYLERSRRKYAALAMPHQSATAEMEIADIYSEINLLPESAEIYERVIEVFNGLGMKAERARSLLNYAGTLLRMKKNERVEDVLIEAEKLFLEEGNVVAAAVVKLTQAQVSFLKDDYKEAQHKAESAEETFLSSGIRRYELTAKFLRGEAARLNRHFDEAFTLLETTVQLAKQQSQNEIVRLCLTSLGKLFVHEQKSNEAENYFGQAIELIENTRTLLSADEMRTAFFANKLAPYDEMIRLCLTNERTEEAFQYLERSRSRALFDSMSGAFQPFTQSQDDEESALCAKLNELREELNWFYSRINRTQRNELSALREFAKERERVIVELERQIQRRAKTSALQSQHFDFESFQSSLSDKVAFVEYALVENEIVAFVVTNKRIEYVCCLESEQEVSKEISQLLFQIKTMRFGTALMERHKETLLNRFMLHSRKLYDLLLRPLEDLFEEKHLAIAPFRSLHSLPFHALHDGEQFVIEKREISYSPSASVWQHIQAKNNSGLRRALFIGVADERTPLVLEEIEALSSLFETSETLLDKEATIDNLNEKAVQADILHFACHGKFRKDNPLFSSLNLHKENLTVKDIYRLNFQGNFVALSACETGLNTIVSGEELIGLARGFLSIGVSSLLLTLWTVNDAAALRLMKSFYESFCTGESAANALRKAQCEMINAKLHPYIWSPFVLIGR